MDNVVTKIALKAETKELRYYIVKCKTDIIKWMFFFSIAQIGTTALILKLLLK